MGSEEFRRRGSNKKSDVEIIFSDLNNLVVVTTTPEESVKKIFINMDLRFKGRKC